MNPLEPGDPLWKVLGRASKAEPSASFAAKVVGAARRLEQGRSGSWLSEWWQSFAAALLPRPRLALACGGALAALLLSLALIPSGERSAEDLVASAESGEAGDFFDPAMELEAVEYLAQLMAVADPGQLDDAVLVDLFF